MTIKQILGKTITQFSRRFGYDFVKLSHSSLGGQDSVEGLAAHLRELFASSGVDTVIDVGANKGQYYEFLRDRVGFAGRIISFEPIPDLAADLSARAARDPLLTVCAYALGSRNEVSTIKIAENSGWSSLLDKAQVQTTEVADSVKVQSIATIDVRRLDGVLPELIKEDRNRRVYLKVDAQGLDLEVLKGAGRFLGDFVALQTELELIPIYENSPSHIAVLSYLEENQFAITGAFPIWRDKSLRIGELDTVFRNRRFLT